MTLKIAVLAPITTELPVMPPVIPQVTENGSKKIDLDSEEIARIVQALEHYHAYLRSQRRDDNGRYLRLAERLRPQK